MSTDNPNEVVVLDLTTETIDPNQQITNTDQVAVESMPEVMDSNIQNSNADTSVVETQIDTQPIVETAPAQLDSSLPHVDPLTPTEVTSIVDNNPVEIDPIIAQTIRQEPLPTDIGQFIEHKKHHGSKSHKDLIYTIEKYVSDMKPGKPLKFHEGATHQINLWKAISSLISHTSHDEFSALWGLLLLLVHVHKDGVFHDRYVFRFSHPDTNSPSPWRDTDLTAFQRIMSIIKISADPETRHNTTKQVHLERSLEVGFTESDVQKLINFYTS